jgi:hypothetical protein
VLNNKIQDDHNISPNLKLEYMGEQISSASFVREHPLTIHVHEGSIMFEVSRKKLLFIR